MALTSNLSKYVRFILRRERIVGAAWLAGIAAFALLISALYPGMFASEEALRGMAATMDTPAMVAMMGPVYGMEALTPAMVMAQECLLWFAIAAIVMNVFFVTRYTRADEELGRFESLSALPVGRMSNSAATLACALGLNVAVAALVTGAALVVRIEGATIAGALAYGMSVGAQGFLFATITLLCAQLFSTTRGGMGVAFAIMGVAYVARAQGDMSGGALSYISPLGLGLKVEAFYANSLMPVAVLLAEAVAVAAVALAINAKRDLGMGVFPARKGRADASRFLQSPLGYAWRVSRNGFFAWAVCIAGIAAAYGAVIGELDTFVSGNDMLAQILSGSGSLVDGFVSFIGGIDAMLIAIPLIGCMNRLRSEEARGRIEAILSASVPRRKLFCCFALIAALESVALALLGVIGLYAASQGAGLIKFGPLLAAGLAYVPAMLAVAGLAALLVGCAPKLTAVSWAVLGYSFVVFYFGRIANMPEAAQRLSPFGNVPAMPVEPFSAAPLAVLCAIAVVLFAAGLVGYGRRDIGR